jgi:hypothetical protein
MKHQKTSMTVLGFLLLCVLIGGISVVYGSENGSALKASPDQYDFGTIAEGENAVITAVIQNTGNTPIEITNVRTS